MTQMTTYWILMILLCLTYAIDLIKLNVRYSQCFEEHDSLVEAIDEQNDTINEIVEEFNNMVDNYTKDMVDFEKLKAEHLQLKSKYEDLLKNTKDKKEITK